MTGASPLGTYAALAGAQTYLGSSQGGPLVGRLVANTEFLRALLRYGTFAQYRFFVGEAPEAEALRSLILDRGWIDPARVRVDNVVALPGALARDEISVLHHASHVDRWNDLLALRDRYAAHPIPVTGQVHSLSYPRLMTSYLMTALVQPRACDAIVCSSGSGRAALAHGLGDATRFLASRGVPTPAGEDATICRLPVIPLGVDAEAVAKGDRSRLRRAHAIGDEDVVVLCLGRFSEYDKADLFPVLHAFRNVMNRSQRPLKLMLAGARQGTKTPEMLALWAQALGLRANDVTFLIDFDEADKADLLAAADVFVSMSDNLQETFGLSVVEAMAAGRAVLVSDFDGYRDTVPDSVGLRVRTRWGCDPTPLAGLSALIYERPLHLMLGQAVEVDRYDLEAKLLLLCHDDQLRARYAAAAAAWAHQQFSWAHVIPQYEALWRELAALARSLPRTAGEPLPVMDHARHFGHYTTSPVQETSRERLVRRSAFADELLAKGVDHPVYPDLKNLVAHADIGKALQLAEAPVSLTELRRALLPKGQGAGDALDTFTADFTVGWMLKHGLLE